MPTNSLDVVVVIMIMRWIWRWTRKRTTADKKLDMGMGEKMDTYLTYLVIIAKEVKMVKEVISCDVLPLPIFVH